MPPTLKLGPDPQHVDEQVIGLPIEHDHPRDRLIGLEEVHPARGDQRGMVGEHRGRRLADRLDVRAKRRVDAGLHARPVGGTRRTDGAHDRFRCGSAR
jgi:hypothetical protein